MAKQLRYIEISNRNPITRILIGNRARCEDVSIRIIRAGSKDCGCNTVCAPDNPCTACGTSGSKSCGGNCYTSFNPSSIGCCTDVTVQALEIDDDGYAVFQWPNSATSLPEGWYDGIVTNGCDICGKLPVRVGARANVLKVETDILGPDHMCQETCTTDGCDPICPTKTDTGTTVQVYIPNEV